MASAEVSSEVSEVSEVFRRLFHPLAAWRWRVRGRGRRLSAGELDRARHAAIQLPDNNHTPTDTRPRQLKKNLLILRMPPACPVH
eukprot:scaffold11902_cov112-Isochrysis_galbana.AAC.8